MANKEEKVGFHFVIVTESDIENETKNLVNKITEDKISEYVFNGESLYETGGHGHSFGIGYYYEYITKRGLRATQYLSGKWIIGNEDYHRVNGEFIIVEKPKTYEINWGDVTFPVVKNVKPKTLTSELASLKPIDNGK